MASGITAPLQSILGINTTAGTDQLQQALATLQALQVPSIDQLSLPELQKYVQAGVLTPQQYQAISADPTAFQKIAGSTDMSGQAAQKAALQELGGIVSAGGSTPINQANLVNNINTTNQAMQGARGAIEQNAQERGVSGGGLEFIDKLMNEQGNASNANSTAVNSAASNAQLALQALTQQGALGGSIQSQSSADAMAKAQAAQQIAEYNSGLQTTANQYNTEQANQAQATNLANSQAISDKNTANANARTQYNATVPQTIYGDTLNKATAVSNAYGNAANLAENQAQQSNAFTGNLLGAGANLAGDYMLAAALAKGGEIPDNPAGGKCYAKGGEAHSHEICMKLGGTVPGEARVPGDSEVNDTVPARLSPHEIVLPRSVSQAPNAPQAAAQFVGGIKGQPSPLSFADVIKKLEENGLELRLGVK